MSTIVTRAGKGSPLTHTEVDNNFTNLNTDKYQSGNNASFGTLSSSGTTTLNGTTIPANKTLVVTTDIGTSVQAYDAQLADVAGLTPTDNNFIVGNGTNFVTESGSTARTSLGLGSIATQDANNVAITGGSINGTAIGGTTAAAGKFTTLEATGVTTVQAGTASAPAITTSGDTNTGIFFPAADTIAFTEGGAEAMRIDSSGNVGIGTTSVSYGLHVSKAQGSAGIQSTTTTNSTYLAFINGGGTSYVGVDNSTGGTFSSGAYGMTLFNAANSPTTFMTNATERMRIASNGDVSIGSTASNGKLFVDATNKIAVYGNVSGAHVAGYFITAGANYAVYGQSSANYGVYGRTTDTSYGGVIGVAADGTTYGILAYANAYSLYTNASIYVNGTVYGSDERLKENIKPINNALSKINQLNPVSFDWKANSSKGITNNNQPLPDYGMIAQEVEQVLPDIVYEIPVPPKPIENNQPDSIEQELGLTKGVDYSRLIPFLTKAIQEQQAMIEELKAEVALLKSK